MGFEQLFQEQILLVLLASSTRKKKTCNIFKNVQFFLKYCSFKKNCMFFLSCGRGFNVLVLPRIFKTNPHKYIIMNGSITVAVFKQRALLENPKQTINIWLFSLRPYSHETFLHAILRYCDKKIFFFRQ